MVTIICHHCNYFRYISTLKINNNHNILSVLKNKTNANGELLSLGPKRKENTKRILGAKMEGGFRAGNKGFWGEEPIKSRLSIL